MGCNKVGGLIHFGCSKEGGLAKESMVFNFYRILLSSQHKAGCYFFVIIYALCA